MTDNVIALPGSGYVAPSEDQERVITCLERALDDARSGRLVSVALCGMIADGAFATAFEAAGDALSLIGVVEILRYRMMLQAHE